MIGELAGRGGGDLSSRCAYDWRIGWVGVGGGIYRAGVPMVEELTGVRGGGGLVNQVCL